MYVQGVSTRKVAKITEKLCGFEISSTQVSRATAILDEQLISWRERPLGSFPYIVLDARYEKVRHGGSVIGCAVLIALGVDTASKRQILGCSVSLSEQEPHWREFLSGLKDRGLHGIEFFVSDAHEGLKAARKAVFHGVLWQRCQFHLQQNAQRYVPHHSMKKAARMLRRHRPLLLNWFRAKKQFSSGIVEGFNTKAKLTTRKAYDFRTCHADEIALYHALGALPVLKTTHVFF